MQSSEKQNVNNRDLHSSPLKSMFHIVLGNPVCQIGTSVAAADSVQLGNSRCTVLRTGDSTPHTIYPVLIDTLEIMTVLIFHGL